MSHKKYASPLRVKIVPSKMLITVVISLHAGAISIVAVSDLPWMTGWLLVVPVFISLWMFLAIHGRMGSLNYFKNSYPRIHSAVWQHDNSWSLMTDDGREFKAELLASSFVIPQLTIINLKIPGNPWYTRYRSLLFLADNLDVDVFRRLRVRLRWYSMPEQESSAVLK